MESNRSARRRAASRRSQRRLTSVALIAVLLGAGWVVFDARNGVALVVTGFALLWFTSLRIVAQLGRIDDDDRDEFDDLRRPTKTRGRRRLTKSLRFMTSPSTRRG